jgi:hypothetical protein
LNLHNETNISQMSRELVHIRHGVSDIKVDVGELNAKVSLLLSALPEQLSALRQGLEGLLSGSVVAMLRQGVREDICTELADLSASFGDQVHIDMHDVKGVIHDPVLTADVCS